MKGQQNLSDDLCHDHNLMTSNIHIVNSFFEFSWLSYLAHVHISFSHTIHCNLHNFCWHMTFPTLLYTYQHQNNWAYILMAQGRQGDGVQKFSSQFFHKGPVYRNVSIRIHCYWAYKEEKNIAGIVKGFTQMVQCLTVS